MAPSSSIPPPDRSRSPDAAVLVLHGGSADSFASTRWRDLAVLRLWPVARAIARDVPDATVYRLRFSIRGWNGSGDAALRDARWALDIIRNREPGIPIVLVGHSLGGRVALRVGGDQDDRRRGRPDALDPVGRSGRPVGRGAGGHHPGRSRSGDPGADHPALAGPGRACRARG